MLYIPAEPANAIRAKDDFWSLGPNRSLKALLAEYEAGNPNDVPTLSLRELQKWHRDYEWQAFCAEREARISEKTEAMVEHSRASKKDKRLKMQDEGLTLCAHLITQLKEYMTGFHPEVVAELIDCDPETGEPEYSYSVQQVPNLTSKEYVQMFPKVMHATVELMKMQKIELGEETQRFHVTIEQVVNALPAPLQAPMREALYEELLRPKGLEPAYAYSDEE